MSAPPRNDDAWIMVGDLPRALYQAGVVEALLEHEPPPRLAYASGLATANALLLGRGSAGTVRRGWEDLRARRLVARVAVHRLPLVGPTLASAAEVAAILEDIVEDRSATGRATELELLENGHFAEPAVDDGHPLIASTSLLATGDCVATLAQAIVDAARRGAPRVLLVGVSQSEAASADVLDAAQEARHRGAELEMVPYEPHAEPRALAMLLPGTGSVERLIRDGRLAGRRWLASNGAAEAAAPGETD